MALHDQLINVCKKLDAYLKVPPPYRNMYSANYEDISYAEYEYMYRLTKKELFAEISKLDHFKYIDHSKHIKMINAVIDLIGDYHDEIESNPNDCTKRQEAYLNARKSLTEFLKSI